MVFKKEFTQRCSAHSRAFIETIEEEYPSSVAYEDNAACLQFAKLPKLSPCNILGYVTIGLGEKC